MKDNIPNLPGYHITEDGKLFSRKSGVWKERKGEIPYPRNSKYPGRLQYWIGNRWYKASRLVALVYCPNPNNYPIVMHLDNDPTNNHYTNLKWGTYSMNNKQCSDEGRGIQYRLKGELNPMYGRKGELSPMYGRKGPLHPCFGKPGIMKGKHHSKETREKIGISVKLRQATTRKLTPRKLRRIHKMRSNSKSQSYIARRVHLHQTAISKVLNSILTL